MAPWPWDAVIGRIQRKRERREARAEICYELHLVWLDQMLHHALKRSYAWKRNKWVWDDNGNARGFPHERFFAEILTDSELDLQFRDAFLESGWYDDYMATLVEDERRDDDGSDYDPDERRDTEIPKPASDTVEWRDLWVEGIVHDPEGRDEQWFNWPWWDDDALEEEIRDYQDWLDYCNDFGQLHSTTYSNGINEPLWERDMERHKAGERYHRDTQRTVKKYIAANVRKPADKAVLPHTVTPTSRKAIRKMIRFESR